MRLAALLIGIVLTAAIFFALCQAMLVPRRPSSFTVRAVNRAVAALAKAPLRLFRSYEAQDRWLSGAAPMSVLMQLIVYVIILILTMGLVVYGTTTLSLNDSLYQSGSTLTTLGIVEPVNEASSIATFVAAFLGLVVIAIFIGYLMAIYGAYVARESGMARAAMLAGEPAWGPMMIVRGRLLGLPDNELPDAALWIDWVCSTRLTQQVNPVLMEFRSTSPRRHWVTTTLAVMDAAALRISLSDAPPDPHQVQLLTEGAVTLATLANPSADPAHNWDVERTILVAVRDSDPPIDGQCGVTREQFDDALAMMPQLRDQGVTGQQAWQRFQVIRSVYFDSAAHLAQRLHAVPAPWSGPRTPAIDVQFPELPRL